MPVENSRSLCEGSTPEKKQGSQDETTSIPMDQAASSSAHDAKSGSSESTMPKGKPQDADEREAHRKKKEEDAVRSDEMMMLHWFTFGS